MEQERGAIHKVWSRGTRKRESWAVWLSLGTQKSRSKLVQPLKGHELKEVPHQT